MHRYDSYLCCCSCRSIEIISYITIKSYSALRRVGFFLARLLFKKLTYSLLINRYLADLMYFFDGNGNCL